MRCQQDELYRAEEEVLDRLMGPEFETEEQLQLYVDALRDLPHWERKHSKVLRIEAGFCPGPSSVGGWDGEKQAGRIEMAPAHRREMFVCHEVAHVLAEARYGSRAHDPWFARTYLELVNAAMSTDTYLQLYHAFDRHGIDSLIENEADGVIAPPAKM